MLQLSMAGRLVSYACRKWHALCLLLIVHVFVFVFYDLFLGDPYARMWRSVELPGAFINVSRLPASSLEFDTENNATHQFSYQLAPTLTIPPSDASCGYLVRVPAGGRLGNQMFTYASFYGTVMRQRRANKTAFLRIWNDPYYLDSVFPNLSIPRRVVSNEWVNEAGFSRLYESACCRYDGRGLEGLSCDGMNVSVDGYRQSYRYFSDFTNEIKKEFSFDPNITRSCRDLFDERLHQIQPSGSTCATVGVHLRRGDFLLPDKQAHGHWPAQFDYFQRVVEFYGTWNFGNGSDVDGKKHSHSDCLAFLLFGNDYEWNGNVSKNVTLLHPNRTHFIIIDPDDASPEIDLCTMTLCDHVAITTGTFGWWAGFFSRGLVTYQNEYARNGSYHFSEYDPEEYFLESWIPL